MLQLSRAFESFGLECIGRRESFETLSGGEGPWVAHLNNPDHFIVLVSLEPKEGRIHAFDPLGKRETISIDQFKERWSGKLLQVRRSSVKEPLPRRENASSKGPRIQFQHLFIDKGSVYANGEPATYDFRFENLGDQPLVIQSVMPSCACLKVEQPKEPIPQGENGTISVSLDPGKAGGTFLHAIELKTNDPVIPRLRLQASGFVSTNVMVKPSSIHVGNVLPGTTVRRQCFLQYFDKTTQLKVKDIRLDLPGATAHWLEELEDVAEIKELWQNAGEKVDLPAGVSVIQLAFTPPNSAVGPISTVMEVDSNIKGFERILIPISGTVTRPITISPSILSFGEVQRSSRSEAVIRLTAMTDQAFQILSVECEGVPDLDWKVRKRETAGIQELVVGLQGEDAIKMSGKLLQIKVSLGNESAPAVYSCQVFAVSKD